MNSPVNQRLGGWWLAMVNSRCVFPVLSNLLAQPLSQLRLAPHPFDHQQTLPDATPFGYIWPGVKVTAETQTQPNRLTIIPPPPTPEANAGPLVGTPTPKISPTGQGDSRLSGPGDQRAASANPGPGKPRYAHHHLQAELKAQHVVHGRWLDLALKPRCCFKGSGQKRARRGAPPAVHDIYLEGIGWAGNDKRLMSPESTC